MFSKLRASALAVVQEVSALLSPPESVQVCLRDSVAGPKEPLCIVDPTFRQVPFSHVSSQFSCCPVGRSIVSKVGAKIECFPGVSVAVRLAGWAQFSWVCQEVQELHR